MCYTDNTVYKVNGDYIRPRVKGMRSCDTS